MPRTPSPIVTNIIRDANDAPWAEIPYCLVFNYDDECNFKNHYQIEKSSVIDIIGFH